VQEKSVIAFCKYNIALTQAIGWNGPDLHHLAVADHGRHAGAPRLEAHAQAARQQLPAQGFE
jgi:hypothetical protein